MKKSLFNKILNPFQRESNDFLHLVENSCSLFSEIFAHGIPNNKCDGRIDDNKQIVEMKQHVERDRDMMPENVKSFQRLSIN